MRARTGIRGGMALIFVIGMLALFAVLGTQFTRLSQIDRTLGGNYVWQARARLAMESGLELALTRLREQCPGGPMEEAVLREWGYEYANPSAECMTRPDTRVAFARTWTTAAVSRAVSGVLESGTGLVHEVRLADESGKLNLNDTNSVPAASADDVENMGWAHGRLYVMARLTIGAALGDDARGRQAADALFVNEATCRSGYPGDRFPDPAAVNRALAAAGLSPEERTLSREYFTLQSWADETVLKPNLRVYGRRATRQLQGTDAQRNPLTRTYDVIGVDYDGTGAPLAGDTLDQLLDTPVESHLAIQGRDWELEARAPVNVNTARHEVLYALILPLQGIYLEEGPVENQSSEHYGWWSTGLGEPDENVFNMGRLKRTAAFTDERARRLAQALYDRIHGIANADWKPDHQPDRDGDGRPEPNPFETWEEFSHGLREGLVDQGPDAPANALLLGEAISITSARDEVIPYDPAHGFVDPHRGSTQPDDQWYRSRHLNQTVQLCNRSSSSATWSWGEEQHAWWRRYFREIQCDLLCAAFNPNARLNDFNPNASMFSRVDKGQLSAYTTELCFEPTGVFSVEVRGLAWGPGAAPMAEASATVAARLFTPLRITSQSQFLEGLQHSEDLGAYFSTQAWLPGVQLAHKTRAGRLSLQSYPEPLYPGAEAAIAHSKFDGCLMPATLEPTPALSVMKVADFNGFNLEPLRLHNNASSPTPTPCFEVHADACNPVHAGPVCAADGGAPGTPGIVYPDGAYSDANRVLAYPWRAFGGGITGFTANAFSFWLKPNFHTGIATRIRKFCTGPTRAGRYARQTLFPLYLLLNPGSNEFNGFTCGLNPLDPSRSFTICGARGNNADGLLYGHGYRNYWAPTRCLAFGFSWQGNPNDRNSFIEGGLIGRSITRDYPLASQPGNVPEWAYTPADYFNSIHGHEWNHVGLKWSIPAGSSNYTMSVLINGRTMMNTFLSFSSAQACRTSRGVIWNRYQGTYSPPLAQITFDNTDINAQWFRFGELPAGSHGASPEASPYAADATFDEVFFHAASSANPADRYGNGRYLSLSLTDETDAAGAYPYIGCYTSPRIRPREKLGRASAWTLRAIAWTLIRPRHNRVEGNPEAVGDIVMDNVKGIVVNPGDKPDPMGRLWARDTQPDHAPWDPISADILPPETQGNPDAGEWYYRGAIDGGWERCLTYPGGSAFSDAGAATYAHGDVFRYRLYFHIHRNGNQPDSRQRLLEAPALDDVTLTFWRDRPEILAWEGA